MKLHQLLYFLETAKHEHIGKAAKILAISPSAISHSISALEDELGRQLFQKHGKNILLTNHGKLLFERVSKLWNEFEIIKEEIMSDQVELQGTYRLAASHLLCPALLAPAWIGIQQNNPRLIGELYTLRSAQVLEGVGAGEYELGLCFSPQSNPNVQIQKLYDGQLVVAVRRNHPLLKIKKKDQVRAISAYSATLPKSYQGIDNCQTHPVFDQFNLNPQIDLIFDNYEVAVEKIRLSDAWGLLPDWIVEQSDLASVIPEKWSAPVNISAMWPKNIVVTRVIKQLIASLERALSRAQAVASTKQNRSAPDSLRT